MKRNIFIFSLFIVLLIIVLPSGRAQIPEPPIKLSVTAKFINGTIVSNGTLYAVDYNNRSIVVSLEAVPIHSGRIPLEYPYSGVILVAKPPSGKYYLVLEVNGVKILSNKSYVWNESNETLSLAAYFYIPKNCNLLDGWYYSGRKLRSGEWCPGKCEYREYFWNWTDCYYEVLATCESVCFEYGKIENGKICTNVDSDPCLEWKTLPRSNISRGGIGGGGGIGGEILVSTENVTEIVIRKLEQEGIKEHIQKLIPIEDIVEVNIEKNVTLKVKPSIEKIAEKPEIRNITIKIKKELEKELKRSVEVNITPVETKILIKLVKIKTKSGESKYFVKVEKELKADKVIEVVPKDLAETADKIIWIKGKVLRVLERDPIFEVSPENGTITYLVEGNKTEEVQNTITLMYSYRTKEIQVTGNATNATQPTKPKAKPKSGIPPNITKPTKQGRNITTPSASRKSKINVWIVAGLVIAVIVTGIILYIIL